MLSINVPPDLRPERLAMRDNPARLAASLTRRTCHVHHKDPPRCPDRRPHDRLASPRSLRQFAEASLELQEDHRQFLLLADAQALTDNADDPKRVGRNVCEVALDYLAVGIDPEKSVICVQSRLPALAELTMLYMNYVTVSRLERNPTVKQEIVRRGFQRDIPAGFLCYPVAQAADITAFKAALVPVGEDQLPMIEQSNEIVRRINRQAGREVLPEAGFCVFRGTAPRDRRAVQLRVSDPGRVEGNVVFTYLDAFDDKPDELDGLKAHYRRGGLGDMVLKSA